MTRQLVKPRSTSLDACPNRFQEDGDDAWGADAGRRAGQEADAHKPQVQAAARHPPVGEVGRGGGGWKGAVTGWSVVVASLVGCDIFVFEGLVLQGS